MDTENALTAVEPEETRCNSFAMETGTASAEVSKNENTTDGRE